MTAHNAQYRSPSVSQVNTATSSASHRTPVTNCCQPCTEREGFGIFCLPRAILCEQVSVWGQQESRYRRCWCGRRVWAVPVMLKWIKGLNVDVEVFNVQTFIPSSHICVNADDLWMRVVVEGKKKDLMRHARFELAKSTRSCDYSIGDWNDLVIRSWLDSTNSIQLSSPPLDPTSWCVPFQQQLIGYELSFVSLPRGPPFLDLCHIHIMSLTSTHR